jgi:glycerophosphoryl diester phosphodiesterase
VLQRPPPKAPGRPLVLGHRGASADAPENTLAAFRLALEQGADGVELDVWRCASGEIVVFHDDDGRRIAGSSARITEAPWSELSRLDVGRWRGERFAGERIPLLEEVLAALPSAIVNVELKSSGLGDPRLAWSVAGILRRAAAGDRVIVSSFDPTLVGAFRACAPTVPTGLLFEREQAWPLRSALLARLLLPAALHPERVLVDAETARQWTARGYALNVWTVDAEDEIERLTRLGATALITNAPGRCRETLRRLTGV